MGCVFELMAHSHPAEFLRDAATEAFDEVDRIEAQLSHYRADSDISDLNERGAEMWVRLEPELYTLLCRAQRIAVLTGGAFDMTAANLVRAWGFHGGSGRAPTPEALGEAMAATGFRLLQFDAERSSIRFSRPGVRVQLGALGKGYAVDRIGDVLRRCGVGSALIHAGTSSVLALGSLPDAGSWEVGFRSGASTESRLGVFRLRDQALSISGDYEQYFELDGVRMSHVLDPRNGFPVRGVRTAAVVSDNAADSDALSTAAFVAGPGAALELVERFPGIGLALVPDDGRPPLIAGSCPLTLEGGAG